MSKTDYNERNVITSMRIPRELIREFDEITLKQGLNRSSALSQLMVRYINEYKLQEEILKNLSNPDVMIKVLNGLDKDKLDLLKSLETQNKG